jgi:hypothetical protein
MAQNNQLEYILNENTDEYYFFKQVYQSMLEKNNLSCEKNENKELFFEW